MDYRLNNEALVACVAAQVVKHGCRDLTLAVVTINLLMHDKEMRRMKSSTNSEYTATIVNQVDGGLLTIIMNSLVMMIQGGCMRFEEGVLMLTETGMQMCEQMLDGHSSMLVDILKGIPAVMEKLAKMKGEIMDQRYVIAL